METENPHSPTLTKAHQKVYPRFVAGRFRRARLTLSAFLQAVLFFGPWIQYNGRQAIVIDLANRQFHFFSITFWPQDTYFLLLALIFLAILLFASTALAGRMWCGYACPQTVLTESFVHVERFFEGERARRIKLDKGPWTTNKAARKLGKYSVWAVMSLWLGITFAGYFQNAHGLIVELMTGAVSTSTTVLITVVAFAAFFDFGWFREQMCQYACPYARFQGAMFDADSLIVGYDKKRGEPRLRSKAGGARAGDCIDCSLCVQACPMGIDIRDGLQLECIACTSCLDACDSVMDKIGRPRGLVGYSSQNMLEGKGMKLIRPRVVVYAVILALLAGTFVTLLARRPLLVLDALRKSGNGAVYIITPDGQVSNLYHLRVINKDSRPHVLSLSIEGLSGGKVVVPQNPIAMAPDSEQGFDAFVMHAPGQLPPVTHFTFKIEDIDRPTISQTQEATFVAPAK